MAKAVAQDKALAAQRTTTVAHAHRTRKTTLTKALPKSACRKMHSAKKAILPTRASASTCSAMACTCSPVR